MQDVEVIEDPGAAAAALDPLRKRLLAALAEPASAATLAARVGIARQKVNYHLKTLESHGLVELAEERRLGGITERVLRATAAAYVVSPAAVDAAAADPDEAPDRLSARYLVALAGRVVREVGGMARRAAAAGKRLPTLAIDTEIRFRSAEDRAAFADELTRAVAGLAARYHHDDGRPHRLVVAAHPKPAGAKPGPPIELPEPPEVRLVRRPQDPAGADDPPSAEEPPSADTPSDPRPTPTDGPAADRETSETRETRETRETKETP